MHLLLFHNIVLFLALQLSLFHMHTMLFTV